MSAVMPEHWECIGQAQHKDTVAQVYYRPEVAYLEVCEEINDELADEVFDEEYKCVVTVQRRLGCPPCGAEGDSVCQNIEGRGESIRLAILSVIQDTLAQFDEDPAEQGMISNMFRKLEYLIHDNVRSERLAQARVTELPLNSGAAAVAEDAAE